MAVIGAILVCVALVVVLGWVARRRGGESRGISGSAAMSDEESDKEARRIQQAADDARFAAEVESEKDEDRIRLRIRQDD